MAEPKTKATRASAAAFVAAIKDPDKRKDAKTLLALFRKVTGHQPVMWGTSIIGFGQFHYKGKSGREGDWPLTGFSPRKQAMTVYCMGGFAPYPELMAKLGKYRTGLGCLYFKSLEDLDVPTLTKLVTRSVADTKKQWSAKVKK